MVVILESERNIPFKYNAMAVPEHWDHSFNNLFSQADFVRGSKYGEIL